MKYLEYVIKEALRLHPPVPYFGIIFEQDTVINEHVLPKGTEIMIDVLGLHTPIQNICKILWNLILIDSVMRCLPNETHIICSIFSWSTKLYRSKVCYVGRENLCLSWKSNFQIKSVQNEDDIQECVDLVDKSANGFVYTVF